MRLKMLRGAVIGAGLIGEIDGVYEVDDQVGRELVAMGKAVVVSEAEAEALAGQKKARAPRAKKEAAPATGIPAEGAPVAGVDPAPVVNEARPAAADVAVIADADGGPLDAGAVSGSAE